MCDFQWGAGELILIPLLTLGGVLLAFERMLALCDMSEAKAKSSPFGYGEWI